MRQRATRPTTTGTGLPLADPSAVTVNLTPDLAGPPGRRSRAPAGSPEVNLHGCVALSAVVPVLRSGYPERAPGLESRERASSGERVRCERGAGSWREAWGAHRDHSESSGGACVATTLASRRAIGGTARRARCAVAGGCPGAEAGATVPGRSTARQSAGSGDPSAGRPAAAKASLAASTAATWRSLATSGSRIACATGPTRSFAVISPSPADAPCPLPLRNPLRRTVALPALERRFGFQRGVIVGSRYQLGFPA
jgi:hypothetical protein